MNARSYAIASLMLVAFAPFGLAQEQESQKKTDQTKPAKKQQERKPVKPRKDGLVPVNRKNTVLIDRANKRVVLKGKICNRDALLEMFVCLKERKQHEAIIALDADAFEVHTALLAVGAKPGGPTKWVPKYVPSWGQYVNIFVSWVDKDGKKQRKRAQEMIRRSINRYHMQELKALPAGVKVPFDELRYDTRRKELLWFGPMSDKQYKSLMDLSDARDYRAAIDGFRESAQVRQMDARFIFSGSFFFEDEDKKKHYTAEGGWVVCVANLPEALIDVDVPSSDSDGNQAFEAWTERIPAVGTEVTVELVPLKKFKREPPEAKKPIGKEKLTPGNKKKTPAKAQGKSGGE